MKIILLSGAIKNSGDYLITERTNDLLKYVYPEAEIVKIVGNYSIKDRLDEVNTADIMVIAGGPSYTKKLYPRDIPLVDDLNLIKPRIYILGSGWYGNLTSDQEIWGYKFEETSKVLLKRVERDSKILGCRDYYAVRVLKANGFGSGVMTGCPAWFDILNIKKRYTGSGEVLKILVSDPADMRSFGRQSIDIVQYLKKKFQNARIEYVFHRGTKHDNFTPRKAEREIQKVIEKLKTLNIPYHDIAFGCEGFHLYDDCDLHIGYRVHAHIYNMSIRNRSILLEEDSRGAGVNEAMRLWSIKAYEKKLSSNANIVLKAIDKIIPLSTPNAKAIASLDAYVSYILKTNGDLFNVSYDIMEHYFYKMIGFIESMSQNKV
ncbi:MAG: polysaccharide pyruvyl transferase family protein [Stomatobaculum sp.]